MATGSGELRKAPASEQSKEAVRRLIDALDRRESRCTGMSSRSIGSQMARSPKRGGSPTSSV